MYKRKKNRKFGRETKQRSALMQSLADALITHGRITTTQAKAKSLKTYVEKLVTKGKKNNLGTRRHILRSLGRNSTTKIIKEISPKFSTRNGGYVRVSKLPSRISDGAKMAVIEFIS